MSWDGNWDAKDAAGSRSDRLRDEAATRRRPDREIASDLVRTYANAFMLEPSRCFRLVENDANQGQPVAVRGRWRDGAGTLQMVEACAEHGVELERRRLATRDVGGGAARDALGR